MKRSMIAMLAVLAVTGCTFGRIEPGHVGVVVPLSGGDKGTLETTTNGWYVYSFNTKVYEFPTFNQQWNWTNVDGEGDLKRNERIYFMDNDGLRVGADVGIQFHVPVAAATTLFQTYRQPLDQVRDTVLKMEVRNALNIAAQKFTAEDMFGEKRAQFFTDALNIVQENVGKNGIVVDNLYLNGELELPEQIRHTIQAKLQATMTAQQKENEKRTVEAEAAKQVAQAEGEAKAAVAKAEGEARSRVATAQGEADAAVAAAKGRAAAVLVEAEAQAKANRELAVSMNGAIFELRKLEIQASIQKAYAEKWSGDVPQTILPDQVAGQFLDIRNGFSGGAKK